MKALDELKLNTANKYTGLFSLWMCMYILIKHLEPLNNHDYMKLQAERMLDQHSGDNMNARLKKK